MLKPARTAPPAEPIITLSEAKAHLEVQHGDRDDLIEGLVTAATGHLEKLLDTAFLKQTWMQAYGCWPADGARFPLAPQIQVDSVKYYDADNQIQTLDPSSYWSVEDEFSPVVRWRSFGQLPALYDRPDAMQVSMTVGYGDTPEDVPEPIRLAIKLLVGDWFENREASADGNFQELPYAVNALIRPFRRIFV